MWTIKSAITCKGLDSLVSDLLKGGVSQSQIKTMLTDNPKCLLDLD
ncbi:MAG: hypothetical protein MUO21_09295 [Nitrososphaeraceae archaeon]|nr:hypothetical protein [Nitrososphaeraceae archaeon]